jgi:hypothetical protein
MSFLTNKIGPLPVWGYGAIAAGGTFLLLKKGGGSSAKKKTDPSTDPNSGATTQPPNDAGNYNSTITETSTFGGGTLGFIGRPLQGFGNVFVNLHRHPDGEGYFSGGRRYSDHAFRAHGFEGGGRHEGGRGNHRSFGGFAGGRDRNPGRENNRSNSIRKSFGPNSSRYRDNNQSTPGNSSRDTGQPDRSIAGNSRGGQR